MRLYIRSIIFLVLFNVIAGMACATSLKPIDLNKPDVKAFINLMASSPAFTEKGLRKLLSHAHYNPEVIERINHPFESQSWCAYKSYFTDNKRVELGYRYWEKNKRTFALVEKKYGVPASIILGIIGVESYFGTYHGDQAKLFPAIDALSTLAFYYPQRKTFFLNELESFLILCKENGLNPLKLKSSYAGALGQAQFMPSSYQQYAMSASGGGKVDLFTNDADVITSIANYLYRFGWNKGQPIASQKLIPHQAYASFESKGNCTVNHWYLYNNFIVITKYNPSYYYALAVFLLSQKIQQKIGSQGK